jgi:uroporphyrinogen-III decarboxylase
MTGQEKMEAAFSPEGTREIPAIICYESIFYRDHFAAITQEPWWALHGGCPERHLAIHRDRIRSIGQDWFGLPTGPSHYDRENVFVEQRADGFHRVDRRTGTSRRLNPPRVSGTFGLSDAAAASPQTPDQVDALIPISTDAELDAAFMSGATDLTNVLLADEGRALMPHGAIGTPLWGCVEIWPFNEFMTRLVESPDLIKYACERLARRFEKAVPRMARLGVKVVWLEECWLDMVSPAQYRHFHLPGLHRITEAIRSAGMHSIHYYCGNPWDRMDILLDTGADALSLEESKKGFAIDIDDVVEAVDGRMTVLGNLDAIHLLEHGSEAELRAEIARQIAAGRRNGSRFIMSLGSPVTPGTSVERVRRYCEIAHELGR